MPWVSEGGARDSGIACELQSKKKTFAYFLNDHHGDGIVGVLGKVLPGDNAALIKADPKRFHMPAYVGPRGWVGLRLDVGRVNWGEVEELARGSYQLVAGKMLAALVSDLRRCEPVMIIRGQTAQPRRS